MNEKKFCQPFCSFWLLFLPPFTYQVILSFMDFTIIIPNRMYLQLSQIDWWVVYSLINVFIRFIVLNRLSITRLYFWNQLFKMVAFRLSIWRQHKTNIHSFDSITYSIRASILKIRFGIRKSCKLPFDPSLIFTVFVKWV